MVGGLPLLPERDGLRFRLSGRRSGPRSARGVCGNGARRRRPVRRFSDADKRRYADVLAAADRTVVLADSYSRGCYYRRNDYLVDHAVRVVAWYIRRNSGTGYTVRRARHQGIEVLNLYEDKMNPTLF